MCKTLETNSSALLGTEEVSEEECTLIKSTMLEEKHGYIKEALEQSNKATSNFKITTFIKGLKKSPAWLVYYKTDVSKRELATAFRYQKGCDNCPEGRTGHNQVTFQKHNFRTFS